MSNPPARINPLCLPVGKGRQSASQLFELHFQCRHPLRPEVRRDILRQFVKQELAYLARIVRVTHLASTEPLEYLVQQIAECVRAQLLHFIMADPEL